MGGFVAFCDGEWEVLSKLFCNEELELAQQILHRFSFPLDRDQDLSFNVSPSSFSSIDESFNGDIFFHSNFHNSSQESSPSINSGTTGSFFMPVLNNGIIPANSNHFLPVADEFNISMDFNGFCEKNVTAAFLADQATLCESPNPAQHAELQLKRKPEVAEDGKLEICAPENPKKKSRTSKNGHKAIKKEKENSSNVDHGGSKNGSDGQSYSSCRSEDENASQETNGGSGSGSKTCKALNLNGKTRACRGAATDPQSLYARKRRERINERLRILQNLVPNGTKVDINTMLEEAVQYVKFMQLQIKLLSSDELWMYAPLAYNGWILEVDPHLFIFCEKNGSIVAYQVRRGAMPAMSSVAVDNEIEEPAVELEQPAKRVKQTPLKSGKKEERYS